MGTPYARQHLQNIAKANKSQRENTEFCGALCRIWEVCPEPLREMGGNSFREIILSLRGGRISRPPLLALVVRFIIIRA